jgi:adenylosuccinate synthase
MKKVFLVAGMNYGDEGKGTMVDFLTRYYNAGLVVRFSGGPQAAHNVVTPEKIHHTFAQFGGGTLAGARTHLSRFMLVEPYALLNEANALSYKIKGNPLDCLTIDEMCPIITPFHWLTNKIKELARGENRHSSCGFGVGELRSDQEEGREDLVIYAKDLFETNILHKKLINIQDYRSQFIDKLVDCGPETERLCSIFYQYKIPDLVNFYHNEFLPQVYIVDYRWLDLYVEDEPSPIIFEGAQGVLLDEVFGDAPYNTWTNTTFDNADVLLEKHLPNIQVEKIGVTRTYMTRHGNGPFPSEFLNSFELENFIYPEKIDNYNTEGKWQGKFRVGFFDEGLFHKALGYIKYLDCLAITHQDTLVYGFPVFFNHQVTRLENIPDISWYFKYFHNMPVKYISKGVTANDKEVLYD